MRESTFLKQNEEKWQEFEAVLNDTSGSVQPDQIASLFIILTDDLAFSRTHFPESKTTRYLNHLAGRVHQELYKTKKEKGNRFLEFWKTEVPLIMAGIQLKLLYAFLIFSSGVLIGVLSANYDEDFLEVILGRDYVVMTKQNIEKKKPMAVYGQSSEVDSFLFITVNNIRVSFMAFVAGLLLSVGTALLLIFNGVMLGAFHVLLAKGGYLEESLLTVYIHGTLEISAIVIAGAAGFVLGNSILFPGTYPRLVSLRRGAMKGIKIVLGLVPVFITAGFLEGFVTRYTGMPTALKLTIIILSLSFILYYFVIYPHLLTAKQSYAET